jgi:hypothetical protein
MIVHAMSPDAQKAKFSCSVPYMAMTMKLETKEGSADTLTFLINLSLGRCLDDLMELGCRFREFLNTTSVGKLGEVDSEGRSILAFVNGFRRNIAGVSSTITSQPCEEPQHRFS